MKRRLQSAGLFLVLIFCSAPSSAEHAGTLSLDGLSFIVFEGYENVSLPSGSAIRFQFSDVSAAGSSSLSIAPSDVSIPPIEIRPGVTLTYTLAAPASGSIRRVAGAVQIDFEGTIKASLAQSDGDSSANYTLHFTTRETTATSADQTESVEIEGTPVIPGPNYLQIVAGATNRPDAFPGPGAAVYGVLSGTFDWLPTLP